MAMTQAACADSVGIRSLYRSIDRPTHPLAAKCLAFWDARPADGIMIGRDVPSRAIAGLLNRVIVHEPIDDGRDFKVRIAGSTTRRRFGREITGMNMSELFPAEQLPARLASVITAIDESIPQFADCALASNSMEMLHTELVILPVFAPNHAAKWAMTICCFFG